MVVDGHRPGAVLALGDLAVEVEVLERVVLRAHREPVVLGVVGDAVGDRPGQEHAVVLEPQIPVQRARVMLLDDEPRVLAGPLRRGPAGLRRGLEIALGAIGSQ